MRSRGVPTEKKKERERETDRKEKTSYASRIRAAMIDCNNKIRSRLHGREKEILKNFQAVTICVLATNLRVRPEVLRMLLISTNRYLDFIELYQYHTHTHTRPRVGAREKKYAKCIKYCGCINR